LFESHEIKAATHQSYVSSLRTYFTDRVDNTEEDKVLVGEVGDGFPANNRWYGDLCKKAEGFYQSRAQSEGILARYIR
jgi:hypothetical protein